MSPSNSRREKSKKHPVKLPGRGGKPLIRDGDKPKPKPASFPGKPRRGVA